MEFEEANVLFSINNTLNALNDAPTDLCLTDLDRILGEERDPGAHHYLVLGTVPIKE